MAPIVQLEGSFMVSAFPVILSLAKKRRAFMIAEAVENQSDPVMEEQTCPLQAERI